MGKMQPEDADKRGRAVGKRSESFFRKFQRYGTGDAGIKAACGKGSNQRKKDETGAQNRSYDKRRKQKMALLGSGQMGNRYTGNPDRAAMGECLPGAECRWQEEMVHRGSRTDLERLTAIRKIRCFSGMS